jgi:DNA primase
MPGIDYRAVRAAVKARELLTLIGFYSRERRGAQCRGACPLHEARSHRWYRCCSVNLDRYVYRCFDCGSHGDLLWLYTRFVRLPLFEAVELLCREAGVPVPRLVENGPGGAGH